LQAQGIIGIIVSQPLNIHGSTPDLLLLGLKKWLTRDDSSMDAFAHAIAMFLATGYCNALPET